MTAPDQAWRALESAALAVVKHVPARALLWAMIAFSVALVAVLVSFGVGVLVLDRATLLLGYLLVIPATIPLLAAGAGFVHGLHRGAARALLAIEAQQGFVRHVVDRLLAELGSRLGVDGDAVSVELPALAAHLASALAALGDNDGDSDKSAKAKRRGLAAWVLRRGQKRIARRLTPMLLSTYRALAVENGRVSLALWRERTASALSQELGALLMRPLDTQRAILLLLIALIGCTWWIWLFALARALGHSFNAS